MFQTIQSFKLTLSFPVLAAFNLRANIFQQNCISDITLQSFTMHWKSPAKLLISKISSIPGVPVPNNIYKIHKELELSNTFLQLQSFNYLIDYWHFCSLENFKVPYFLSLTVEQFGVFTTESQRWQNVSEK